MSDTRMWIIIVVVAVLVVGLIAYARGPEHHHGDDLGALRAGSPAPWVQVR